MEGDDDMVEAAADVLEPPEVPLEEEIQRLKDENDLLRRRVFSLDQFKNDNRAFRFYTGVQDYAVIKVLYDMLFKPCLNKLLYYRSGESVTVARRVSAHRWSLDPEVEFFVFLSIMRRGLQQFDLAYRLNVSQSSICRIFYTWLHLVHNRLVQVPIWLQQSTVRDRTPEWFQKLFSGTRVILDCTDFFIQMPSGFWAQSETFSHYKHHNTAKALVAIAPNGAITFASRLYGGKQSDKAIVRHSGILDLLEAGDMLMADRGFEISSLLPPDASLVVPSFMDGRPQLPAKEEKLSRKIASAPVHVERAIRRVKTFRILSHLFPLKMKASLDMIWQVCARLCNFMPPLIASCGPVSSAVPTTSEPSVFEEIDSDDPDDACFGLSHDDDIFDSISPLPSSTDLSVRGLSPSDPGYVPTPPGSPLLLTQPEPAAAASLPVSTEPSSSVVAVCSRSWPPGATPHSISEHFLPSGYCQSRVDGRNGSTACTVIAALSAAGMITSGIQCQFPQHQPSQEAVDQFIRAMRKGNVVYEQTFPDSRPLLGVYDAFSLLESVSCRQDGDLGFRTLEHCQQQLQRVHKRSQEEQCTLAGVLVRTPLSVAVGISPSGHAAVLDSHCHGGYGGLMAVLHNPEDWSSLALYLESLVGQLDDAHFCLIAVSTT